MKKVGILDDSYGAQSEHSVPSNEFISMLRTLLLKATHRGDIPQAKLPKYAKTNAKPRSYNDLAGSLVQPALKFALAKRLYEADVAYQKLHREHIQKWKTDREMTRVARVHVPMNTESTVAVPDPVSCETTKNTLVDIAANRKTGNKSWWETFEANKAERAKNRENRIHPATPDGAPQTPTHPIHPATPDGPPQTPAHPVVTPRTATVPEKMHPQTTTALTAYTPPSTSETTPSTTPRQLSVKINKDGNDGVRLNILEQFEQAENVVKTILPDNLASSSFFLVTNPTDKNVMGSKRNERALVTAKTQKQNRDTRVAISRQHGSMDVEEPQTIVSNRTQSRVTETSIVPAAIPNSAIVPYGPHPLVVAETNWTLAPYNDDDELAAANAIVPYEGLEPHKYDADYLTNISDTDLHSLTAGMTELQVHETAALHVSNYNRDFVTGRRIVGHDSGKLPRLEHHTPEQLARLQDSIVELKQTLGGAMQLITGNAVSAQHIAQHGLGELTYNVDDRLNHYNPHGLSNPYAAQALKELTDHFSLTNKRSYAESVASSERTVDEDSGKPVSRAQSSFQPDLSTVEEEE